MIYILNIISIAVFLIFFFKDKRQLINAFLLLNAIIFTFLSITNFTYEKDLNGAYGIMLAVFYALIPVLLFVFSIFMIVNGIITLKKEGKSLSNSLSLIFGLGIFSYYIITFFYLGNAYMYQTNRSLLNDFIMCVYYLLSFYFLIFLFIFFAFLIYSILYLSIPKKKDYDFIVIHGAGLIDGCKVSHLLAGRIEKAIKAFYLAKKEGVKLIASGGKGRDEKVSEAYAIKEYLLKRGIKEEDIILEDTSKTTYENLENSYKIAKNIKEDPKFLFVSSDYHIFRTIWYAKKLKIKGEGLGSKTARYYIPSAFLREYIAVIAKLKWILLLLSAAFLTFIIITLY